MNLSLMSTPATSHMNQLKANHRPSWWLTISFSVALAALYFTSSNPIAFALAFIAVWPHFLAARLPRDSSSVWIIRLLIYGFVFAFFGAQPGIGADWIFDAKTFNMIGFIAAGEAALELWREPPVSSRYHAVVIFCIGIVFLAACNTYDDRYIGLLAPFYLLFTLLALREWKPETTFPNQRIAFLQLPRGRGVLALVLVVALGVGAHFTVVKQRDEIMRLGFQMMQHRRFFQGSGISEQPNLGSTFNLRGGTQRVLKIEGSLNDGHLRAAAFDTYSNGSWSPTVSNRAKVAFPDAQKPGDSARKARITKLDDLNKLIFAPLNATSLVPGLGSSFEWNKNLGPIICDDVIPYSYDVFWSDEGSDLGVPLHQGVLCVPLSHEDTKRWLQLPPEVDPRVKKLALELTETAIEPAEKVEAIGEYLLKNNKYSRTTTRGKGDPTSNFILQKKSAHCEYFASATVVLLRAAGVPSRYVTGYMAHEKNGDGTVVRQRDAHAWAEAWIDGAGWITVDATPADGTPEGNEPVSSWQRWREKLQDTIAKWRENLTALSPTQIAFFIALIVVIWSLERWRVRRKQNQQLTREFKYSAPENLVALAARFENFLKRQNEEISQSKPLAEYSGDEAARQFLKEYNRARFGGNNSDEVLRELTWQIETLEKSAQNSAAKKTVSQGNPHDINNANTNAAADN